MKKGKKFWIVLILIILLLIGICAYVKATNNDALSDEINTTNIVNTKVSTQTIINTLTSSGAISSALTEKLSLNTSKYFETICVEENDYVGEGENILEYTDGTYLTAPYNLVVTSISVPEAESICSTTNYIQVESLDELYMTLSIDESEIGEVEQGQEVEIVVNAFEEKTYTGQIVKINEIGTYNSSGTSFNATVSFENDGNIKIGMSASCTVILEKVENAISVPIEAVQTQSGEKYVIIVNEDGTTENRIIETGISNDAYVEVKSGLDGTETIQMTEQVSGTSNNNRGGNRQQGGQGSGQMPNFGGWQMPAEMPSMGGMK